MNFYVKRLFLNPYNKSQNNFTNKNIYLKSNNNYIKNKFINALSNKFYNIKTNYIYFHDDFKTNYINALLMPELNFSISSFNNQNSSKTIDLNSTIKNYSENDIKTLKNNISSMHKDFSNIICKINELFSSICKNHSLNLNKDKFYDFKYDFINHIFKNQGEKTPFKISEYLISSVGIEGFKTFSNYLPQDENKVFVINDDFNIFKPLLLNEIFNKSIDLNISVEIYRNPLNKKIIDHIKIPSLNVCIISNNFLFNEKVPGVQINSEDFSLNKISFKEIKNDYENITLLIKDLNLLCTTLRKNYNELYKFFDDYVIENKFNDLVFNTLKNVIR